MELITKNIILLSVLAIVNSCAMGGNVVKVNKNYKIYLPCDSGERQAFTKVKDIKSEKGSCSELTGKILCSGMTVLEIYARYSCEGSRNEIITLKKDGKEYRLIDTIVGPSGEGALLDIAFDHKSLHYAISQPMLFRPVADERWLLYWEPR